MFVRFVSLFVASIKHRWKGWETCQQVGQDAHDILVVWNGMKHIKIYHTFGSERLSIF